MKSQFSTFDITKALGIPRERLKDWMNNNFIQATQPAQGKGTKAIFTLMDVYGVALFQDLLQKGFKRETASKFVKGFIHRGIEAFAYVKFIRIKEGAIDTEILSPGEWVLNVNTGKVGEYDPKSKKIKFKEKSPGGDWRSIHMINLKKLREKVDAQLSVLG